MLAGLTERFTGAGFELALVGGPVRDALLGRASTDGGHLAVSDLDLTTDATPDQTLELVRGWADTHWEIGRAFGTIGAARQGLVVEITTYRSDTYADASRKPQVVLGSDLPTDLSRRDFTVNAMALRLPGLELLDPFDGLMDLAFGVLRTPIDPSVSFGDDPLRMMRAARFVAQLGFTIDDAALAAMRQMSDRIGIVSAERVQQELRKLIAGAHPRAGLQVLVDSGLAGVMLPELPALKLEVDEHHRHKDVYEHTLTVLDQAIDLETGPDGPVPGPDFVLRFAAVMHDIGKPATRRFEPGGGVSFHHHEVVGAKMTARRMRALKFDKDTTKQVARLVELHLRFHGYSDQAWTDSAVRRYVTDAGPLLERLHRLTRADCTTRNRRKAARLRAAYDDLEDRIAQLRESEELARIRPDLDGTQIMRILDTPPGPAVGKAYRFLLNLRLEEGPLGPQAAERALREWAAEHLD
ncbi:MAG: CCA tRNA nucleotidyltransferase [Micrococcales bacterium]|nr:MAG: CCA tRNA nucleotidyltransferase [Micrococcales bacterium]